MPLLREWSIPRSYCPFTLASKRVLLINLHSIIASSYSNLCLFCRTILAYCINRNKFDLFVRMSFGRSYYSQIATCSNATIKFVEINSFEFSSACTVIRSAHEHAYTYSRRTGLARLWLANSQLMTFHQASTYFARAFL